MKRVLLRTKAFDQAARRYLKKHPGQVAELQVTLELLAEDAFHPRLRTHKLKGDLDGCWACSAGYDVRIVFTVAQNQ